VSFMNVSICTKCMCVFLSECYERTSAECVLSGCYERTCAECVLSGCYERTCAECVLSGCYEVLVRNVC
jgi:hypothetical protein